MAIFKNCFLFITVEMHANNTKRVRAHTISGASTAESPLYDGYENEDCFGQVFCPKWGCGLDDGVEILSRSRSSSSSISDCLTDDSVEGDYTHLENRHFEKALNKGVFNSVYERARKDRRKSFEKDQHHHHHHHHHHRHHKRSFDDDTSDGCMNRDGERRVRSSSFDVRMFTTTAKGENNNNNNEQQPQRRNKKTSKHKKLRQELSNSGINLHDATGNLSIDEIYEMQNRFYSALKVSENFQRQHSIDDAVSSRDLPCSPIRKKRSESFQ